MTQNYTYTSDYEDEIFRYHTRHVQKLFDSIFADLAERPRVTLYL